MTAPKTVPVEEMAIEKLPAYLVEAIDKLVEEAELNVYLGIKQGKIIAEAHIQTSVRKAVIFIIAAVLVLQLAPSLYAYLPLLLALLRRA